MCDAVQDALLQSRHTLAELHNLYVDHNFAWEKRRLSLAKFSCLRDVSMHLWAQGGTADPLRTLPPSVRRLTLVADRGITHIFRCELGLCVARISHAAMCMWATLMWSCFLVIWCAPMPYFRQGRA